MSDPQLWQCSSGTFRSWIWSRALLVTPGALSKRQLQRPGRCCQRRGRLPCTAPCRVAVRLRRGRPDVRVSPSGLAAGHSRASQSKSLGPPLSWCIGSPFLRSSQGCAGLVVWGNLWYGAEGQGTLWLERSQSGPAPNGTRCLSLHCMHRASTHAKVYCVKTWHVCRANRPNAPFTFPLTALCPLGPRLRLPCRRQCTLEPVGMLQHQWGLPVWPLRVRSLRVWHRCKGNETPVGTAVGSNEAVLARSRSSLFATNKHRSDAAELVLNSSAPEVRWR